MKWGLKTFLLGLLLFTCEFSFAGGEIRPTGGRKIALGGAYTGVRGDFWSFFGNPAGMSGMKQMEAGVHFDKNWLLPGTNYGAFGFVFPINSMHSVGIDGWGFGGKNYFESKVGLNYAITFLDRLSLGFRGNFTNVGISNYGSAFAFYADLGLNVKIADGLSLGFQAFNVNRANLNKETNEKIPTVFSLGVAWDISEKVMLVADVEKQIELPFGIKSGIEYKPANFIAIRAGFGTYPISFSAGVGVNWKGLNIDFANTYHERLGYSPHLSLSYKIGKIRVAPVVEEDSL